MMTCTQVFLFIRFLHNLLLLHGLGLLLLPGVLSVPYFCIYYRFYRFMLFGTINQMNSNILLLSHAAP